MSTEMHLNVYSFFAALCGEDDFIDVFNFLLTKKKNGQKSVKLIKTHPGYDVKGQKARGKRFMKITHFASFFSLAARDIRAKLSLQTKSHFMQTRR